MTIPPHSPTPKPTSPSILYPLPWPQVCSLCQYWSLPYGDPRSSFWFTWLYRSFSLHSLMMSISFIGHPSFSSWTTGAGDRNRIERDSEARGGCGRHIVRLFHGFYLFAGAEEDDHVCDSSNILFFKCITCSSGQCVIVWTVPVVLWMYRSNIFYLSGKRKLREASISWMGFHLVWCLLMDFWMMVVLPGTWCGVTELICR